MSFEVEVKYRTEGHTDLAERLASLGAVESQAVAQEDAYLNHPARDFAETNEALRLRRIGSENRITYKGPKRPGPTKTREEIELPFAEGDDAFARMGRLFQNLGFRDVATIRKTRRTFRLKYQDHAMEVVLDEAEGLGSFAEVEAFAKGEADLPNAQQAVLGLAKEIGLTDVEPRSYLRMRLEQDSRDAP